MVASSGEGNKIMNKRISKMKQTKNDKIFEYNDYELNSLTYKDALIMIKEVIAYIIALY